MPLAAYRQKRDFRKTSEPAGRAGKSGHTALSFTVQKHDATRLHYDLRLEMSGVLRSWAVPKGPSLNPKDRRLAVEVEDHPLDYGTFEGTIPKGEYGGGTVLLWDRGTWSPSAGDPVAAYGTGTLKFTLKGERLRGGWTLVRMHDHDPGPKSNWLLIKERDEFAAEAGAPDVTVAEASSVSTGRTLEQIAAGAAAGTRMKRRGARAANRADRSANGAGVRIAAGQRGSTARGGRKSNTLEGAVEAPMPRSIEPQLCTLSDWVPEGAQWRHEVKFDGYRLLAIIERGTVRLVTRSGLDWTERFKELAKRLQLVNAEQAVLDGEVVCLNGDGVSDFQALQSALKHGATAKIVYFVFDVLYMNGYDLRACTLDQRYPALQTLMQGASNTALRTSVRVSEHIDGNGQTVMKHACRLHLEGIVSKRADSEYEGGRSSSWVKVKCGDRQEFVVGGYSDPQRTRSGFGALLLGYYDQSKSLVYAGKVGAGFDEATLKDVAAKLRTLHVKASPFATALDRADGRGAHWVEPRLVVEVDFTQWTTDGKLRHPVYRGLRTDKKPKDVVRERPTSLSRVERVDATTNRDRGASTRAKPPKHKPPDDERGGSVVLGVTITHPGRVVYPKSTITKLEVARYYEGVAEWIMPHIVNRPLSLVRCPQGAGGPCFFNKHLPTAGLKGLREVSIREGKGVRPYVVVDEPSGPVSLAQMNTLELHSWGSPADDLERPDRLVFDLDPGDGVEWRALVRAAERVRRLLESVKLRSFVKTTGGKGLHVVSPFKPGANWDEVKAFSLAIARLLAEQWPDEFVATMSKAKRAGKVFVDYLRNQRGSTSVVAYSTRAREGGTVSMPVEWAQLPKVKPGAFTIETARDYLIRRVRDPWGEVNRRTMVPLPSADGMPAPLGKHGSADV